MSPRGGRDANGVDPAGVEARAGRRHRAAIVRPVALLIALGLALAPSPRLGAELAEIAEAQDHLPLAFVSEVAARLDVVLHDRRGGMAMAYYAPALPSPAAISDAASEGEVAAPGATAGPGTSTSLTPPRLVLYEPYYRRADGSLRPLLEMTPDVVEYLSHALVLAYLHLEVIESEGEYGAMLERRAAERYPELEPDDALGLVVTALASFGSHVLSLGNEIERLHRRRPEADLCGLLRARKLHFASWARAFEEEEYFGVAAEPGGGSVPRRALSVEDKQLFVKNVLEGRWSGDPDRDFGSRLCAGAAPSARRIR